MVALWAWDVRSNAVWEPKIAPNKNAMSKELVMHYEKYDQQVGIQIYKFAVL